MTTTRLTMAALTAALTIASPADAATGYFDFSGSGISGSFTITYQANGNTGPIGTSPNQYDPVGSYIVSDISGTYSNMNSGIANATITGIVKSVPASPTAGNLLAPHSFGFYPIDSKVMTPEGEAPGLSYDNLFYPGGSPQTATDYPFSGGVFDIYGIVFTISGGKAVNFWSNGSIFGAPVRYGSALTDGRTVLDYVGGVSVDAVPEPATWAMLVLGFGMIGGAVRYRRRVGVVAAA